jgi:hypothetical protein
MKTILIILFFVSSYSMTTLGNSIQPNYGKPMVDLETNFPAKCYGTTTRELKCQFWARALKLELEDLLVSMQNASPTESEELHQELLNTGSVILQARALKFTENYSNKKKTYMDKAQEFLFGTNDMPLASVAATYLKNSDESEQMKLGERYFKSRDSSYFDFSFENIDTSTQGSFLESLLASNANDWTNFPSALSRIYIDDAYNTDPANLVNSALWCVSYRSTDMLSDLELKLDKFTNRKALPPRAELEKKQAELQVEMEELGQKLQNGDYSVMPRYQELMALAQVNGKQISWWSRFSEQTPTAKLWVIENPTQEYEVIEGFTLDFDFILNTSILKHFTR